MERRGRARLGGRSGRSAMGGLLPTSCLARGDQGGAECGAPTFNITPPQMEFCNKCTDPNGAKYTIPFTKYKQLKMSVLGCQTCCNTFQSLVFNYV